MANKPKNKMSVADRAKQFIPFSALKGLEEALKKVEDALEAEDNGPDARNSKRTSL